MLTNKHSDQPLKSLSVFLPCFNEAPNLRPLVNQLIETLPSLSKTYEIIIINDGSTDDTLKIAYKLVAQYPQVQVHSHSRNRGYGAAIQTGIKVSRYDWIFFTDGDGQFNVKELKLFLPHTKKFSAVIGYRTNRAEGSLRAFNARLFKLFVDLLFRVHVKDIDCAFKLFKADLIKSLPLQSQGAMISTEILYRLKKQKVTFKQIPVTHLPRRYGRPTGNNFNVILKAGIEAVKLYLDIKTQSYHS